QFQTSVSGIDWYEEGRSTPSGPDDHYLKVQFANERKQISAGEELQFYLYDIKIYPNPAGQKNRELDLLVNLSHEYSSPSYPLKLTLTVPSGESIPYVNFFVSDIFYVHPFGEANLTWQISGTARKMAIQPVIFHQNLEEAVQGQPLEASDAYLIDSNDPIPIHQLDGSLKVKLINSTQLTLIADVENNRGRSELRIYCLQTDILYFIIKGQDGKAARDPGSLVELKWLVSFRKPASRNNKILLIGQEFNNEGKILPLRENSPEPPTGIAATWVVNEHAATSGSFCDFPNRPTTYFLYVTDGDENSTLKIETRSLMITPPNSPLGSVMAYMGDVAKSGIPYGWMICNGQKVSRMQFVGKWTQAYKKQFGTVPANYGDYCHQSFDALVTALNGQNNELHIPSLMGRFLIGVKPSEYPLNKMGGVENVTLKTEQIPPHNHSVAVVQGGEHKHAIGASDGGWAWDHARAGDPRKEKHDQRTIHTNWDGKHGHQVTQNTVGGGQSHDNMPPYYSAYYIIKVLK
ncbi:MAG: hypothetical protein AAFV25_12005, partial [Bacteroidota bacterium]